MAALGASGLGFSRCSRQRGFEVYPNPSTSSNMCAHPVVSTNNPVEDQYDSLQI